MKLRGHVQDPDAQREAIEIWQCIYQRSTRRVAKGWNPHCKQKASFVHRFGRIASCSSYGWYPCSRCGPRATWLHGCTYSFSWKQCGKRNSGTLQKRHWVAKIPRWLGMFKKQIRQLANWSGTLQVVIRQFRQGLRGAPGTLQQTQLRCQGFAIPIGRRALCCVEVHHCGCCRLCGYAVSSMRCHECWGIA